VDEIEQRVADALRAQLEQWRAALDAGAERVGWKIGLNLAPAQRALGLYAPVIGHLTSATRLGSGATYRAGAARELRAEAEVALEVGEQGRIAGYAAALELVDVGRPPSDLEGIVAANVFHRAFALAPSRPAPPEPFTARLAVNGVDHVADRPPDPFSATVDVASHHLATVGERLLPGDRIIAGSVIHVPVAAGDHVVVDMGDLGRLEVRIAP
jgi:2-keto-4-pentenoate hydratase